MTMNSMKRYTVGTSILVALVLAVLGFAGLWVGEAHADTLPAETCTYDGGTNTRTCELWATIGTLTLPDGTSVTIWGYADTSGGAATLPGPAIIANQGETIEVILHNSLAETTALIFPGQTMIPDLVGVPSGGSTTYTFVASNPGTYLYEAGLLPGAQHQVAMGLYGALVVRPTLGAGYAYDDPDTLFVDEALLVLGEIDPALNNSASPADFDLRDYTPKCFLINGVGYPDTGEFLTAAGNKVLLRYVNAGIVQHSMGTLGIDQEVLAVDGSPLGYPFRVAAATIGSGQTSDRMVTVPLSAGASGDSRYAVYDSSMLLHNNGAAGFGGMLTFLTVTGTPPPTGGPTAGAMVLAPNPTDGSVDVTVGATINGAVGTTIASAEYFVDATGTGGTGVILSANDGGFDSQIEDVSATIAVTDLDLLSSGDHTIYVHGQDSTGAWGAFNFVVLHLDKLGPATHSVTLAPNPSAGEVDVSVSATGDDTATGNSDIAAAEYFIDATGADGAGTPLTVNVTAPIASLDGSIPAATMGTLAEGTHTVYIHSMDAFGHWGEYADATLMVDQTGPETSNIVASPNPNNGVLPYSPTVYALRVDATITDAISTIERAEGFIDTAGADGAGFPLTPTDGLFDEAVEDAYVFIPLSTIKALSEGTHPIWIHGQDASGIWGAAVSVDLIIDKTVPTVVDVVADPNPTGAATSVSLTATASDTASDIVTAEWFDGADPGRGNGTPMAVAFNGTDWDLSATIDVSGWAPGVHTISVRARDLAGNWSETGTTPLCVVQCNDIFADSFGSGDTSAWASTTGAVSVIAGAAMDGDGFGMAADISGGTAGYVTDGTPDAESTYHARFYFNPNSTLGQNNAEITLLDGQDAGATSIFRVEYRRRNAQGGTYEVRGVVVTAGGDQPTNWVAINNNSANAIEIAWESGAAASFSLYVHGGLQETLAGLDTSAYVLDAVHLGPSSGDGLNGNASGAVYVDAFVSTRYTVIGTELIQQVIRSAP